MCAIDQVASLIEWLEVSSEEGRTNSKALNAETQRARRKEKTRDKAEAFNGRGRRGAEKRGEELEKVKDPTLLRKDRAPALRLAPLNNACAGKSKLLDGTDAPLRWTVLNGKVCLRGTIASAERNHTDGVGRGRRAVLPRILARCCPAWRRSLCRRSSLLLVDFNTLPCAPKISGGC